MPHSTRRLHVEKASAQKPDPHLPRLLLVRHVRMYNTRVYLTRYQGKYVCSWTLFFLSLLEIHAAAVGCSAAHLQRKHRRRGLNFATRHYTHQNASASRPRVVVVATDIARENASTEPSKPRPATQPELVMPNHFDLVSSFSSSSSALSSSSSSSASLSLFSFSFLLPPSPFSLPLPPPPPFPPLPLPKVLRSRRRAKASPPRSLYPSRARWFHCTL